MRPLFLENSRGFQPHPDLGGMLGQPSRGPGLGERELEAGGIRDTAEGGPGGSQRGQPGQVGRNRGESMCLGKTQRGNRVVVASVETRRGKGVL